MILEWYSYELSSKIQLQRKTKTVLAFELSVLLTRNSMITKAIGYLEEGGQVQKLAYENNIPSLQKQF